MKQIVIKPFNIQSYDGTIIGEYLPSGKVTIFKGSLFRKIETNSLRASISNLRKMLIGNGYVKEDVMIKDYTFENPSNAISTLLGRMENGNDSFYTLDGVKLGVYLQDYKDNETILTDIKFLVCNLTWMEKYNGKEPVSNTNWSYVKEHGYGHELYNFYNDEGYYYGFTQLNGKLNIKKIDSNCNEKYVDDVLVVFISRSPEAQLTIVGYYFNATVYAQKQNRINNNLDSPWYYIKAPVNKSYLIPVEDRKFEFPKERKGRPGQSSVWYGENAELKTQIIDYVINVEKNRNHYVKERKLIENDDNMGFVSTLDIDRIININVEYNPEKKPKKIIGNTQSYKRSDYNAKKAIIIANYKCDLDNTHETFFAKNGKPYMEAHHLIPMHVQEQFDVSIDVLANIICLCPNCHKKIHYGMDIQSELKSLYDKRKELLEKQGIQITFKEIMKFYE